MNRILFVFWTVNAVFTGLSLFWDSLQPQLYSYKDEPNYFTSEDGLRLYYEDFCPNNNVSGVVLVTPGIGGIMNGDYDKFGNFLSKNGFAVYVLHPRGTSYSEGKRGDISDFNLILKDFINFIDYIRGLYSGKQFFLFGHSLGGAIAIKLGVETDSGVSGIILVNPAYRYSRQSGPSFWTVISYAFNYIFRPSALTVNMCSDPEKIKHPADRKEAIDRLNDPLIVKRFSMRYMAGARKIMQESLKNARVIDVPLLMIYGAEDEIIDHTGSDEIFNIWRCARKKKVVLQQAGHGIHAVNMSLKVILEWLSDICR